MPTKTHLPFLRSREPKNDFQVAFGWMLDERVGLGRLMCNAVQIHSASVETHTVSSENVLRVSGAFCHEVVSGTADGVLSLDVVPVHVAEGVGAVTSVTEPDVSPVTGMICAGLRSVGFDVVHVAVGVGAETMTTDTEGRSAMGTSVGGL